MCETFQRFGKPGLFGAAALICLAASAGTAAAVPVVPQPAQARSHYVQVAGLFGDSDEEIAARQREQAQDSSIASLTQRIGDVEHSLRQLTGQLEEANHRNAVLQQKIDRMQKDFDYRLCQLSAQQLGASGDKDSAGALDCTGSGMPAATPSGADRAPQFQQQGSAAPSSPSLASGATDGSDGALPQRGRPSGVLGTLPQGTALPRPRADNSQDVTVDMSAVGGAPAPAPHPAATGTGHARFDAAMNLLAKAQYDEARGAFRSFADANPKDDLAPQAVYWVGAIAYVQKDYPGAARAFAEEIKEYPDSPRATGEHAQARPVADRDEAEAGRLHHPWRHLEQIPQSLRDDPP